MTTNKLIYTFLISGVLFSAILFWTWPRDVYNSVKNTNNIKVHVAESISKKIFVKNNITIEKYFNYMDSLVVEYDSLVPYPLSEHLLVRANPWIMDTLANTDYYNMMEQDSFVYNQKKMVVLRNSDSLIVPDSITATKIIKSMKNTLIDVNVPEFKLRIYQDNLLLHTFPIRVGRNTEKYLEMGNRITDLRTIQGYGQIIEHHKNPDFYNPVDGKQFFFTKRDDEKTTYMPQIPWIETEINGVRNGQMIHPTTNPETLEKAYSNGCIGTKEGDAWIIYYYSPLGTPIQIRYDLKIKDINGEELELKDIYGYKK
ncbi:L,D-transpeptidase ErfK/SrfK [Saonia flava]|uniref:L,D-transpeptidase ErfK/SrfK n=1 Tax=Saonia flava TaxID=523696 RepID=A0A846QTW7_9FLAO|nr:L,D-transpeptidase [Saonia flava]NJB70410.1 L,D-transpeptidase ErfK/SrfK [Saonia flava]